MIINEILKFPELGSGGHNWHILCYHSTEIIKVCIEWKQITSDTIVDKKKMRTYCRGYSGGTVNVRKTGQVPIRREGSSPVIPLQHFHLSAVAPPLPGPPTPHLSPSTRVVPTRGSPSRLLRWAARPRATQRTADYKLAARCSPFWNAPKRQWDAA